MAKWGNSGGGMRLPAGRYTAQIVDVKLIESEQLRAQGKDPEQFEWTINVWLGDRWESRKLWTGCTFQDPASIKDIRFVPKLMKLVRACGMSLPTTKEQAEQWDEESLIGRQFELLIQPDPENPDVLKDYLVAPQGGQQAPSPTRPPKAVATPPVSNDPFVSVATTAPTAAQAVAGEADLWQ